MSNQFQLLAFYQIVNVIIPRAWVFVLGCGHISHTVKMNYFLKNLLYSSFTSKNYLKAQRMFSPFIKRVTILTGAQLSMSLRLLEYVAKNQSLQNYLVCKSINKPLRWKLRNLKKGFLMESTR